MKKTRPKSKNSRQDSPPEKKRKVPPGICRPVSDDNSLEEGSKKYRDIIENLEDIIFAVDPAGRVQYVSPNIEKFLGYRPDEIIGEIPVRHMPPEEGRLKYVLFVNLASRHKKIKSLELTGIHKDGRLVTMEANAAPYFSQDGTFLGYRGVCRDTTERRCMEEQLRAGRQKLMQSVKDLELMNGIARILLTSPDDHMYSVVLRAVLTVTQSPLGVFGYIDENGDVVAPSLTQDVWDKCRIEDKSIRFPRDAWTDTVWVRAILQKRTIISNQRGNVPHGHIPIERVMVTPIVFQDRAIGYLKVANRPSDYNANDQALLERIAGFIAPALDARLQRDFEGRKRKVAEEALKTSQLDLKHGQAVARTGSWRLDLVRNELSWSDEAYKIFDVPKGTALNYESFLSRVHPDDREIVKRKWAEAVPGEIYEMEFRILSGDTVKWVRGRTDLESDEGGNMRGGFGTVQDITESKRIEESLRESEERFRSIFHKGAVPMAVVAAMNSRFILVNSVYCEMLGYPEAELLRMSFYDITHPDDIPVNKVGIDAVFSGTRDSFRM
ncbi:MAG: PAS domain S-box protein, partial [Syntrophaceae bacterium]